MMRALDFTSLNWFLLTLLYAYQSQAVAIEPSVQTSLSFTNSSLGGIASQAFTDLNTKTYYSTHPSIHYLPRSDCVYWRFGMWCTRRDYAWKRIDYIVEPSSSMRRSAGEVNNERNDRSGNGPREVQFDLPPGESISLSTVLEA